jgi:hypothetical protein
MGNSQGFSRLGMLALGLGVGAAIAHSPGTAAADSSTNWLSSTDALLVGGLPAQSSGLDLAISFNGMSLVSDGTAIANSGTAGDYDLAIAYGDNATAFANGGSDNSALAIGPDASAVATNGNYDSATAVNGIASAGYGNHDAALAIGDKAGALGGDYNTAFQWGQDEYALAGDGSNNFASGIGAGSGDFTGGGFNGYNLAYAGGTHDLWGGHNIASLLGNNGNALAGNDLLNGGASVGNYDIASVFGLNNTTANATGADNLYDLFSSSGHQTGTAAVSAADAANVAPTSDLMVAATTAGYNSDFLSGSTNALVLGPTGISTPDPAYIQDALNLYLYPNGYEGTTATTLPLTTPETNDFATSVPQGETILINAIQADYNAGLMDCNSAGVCSDPLTIFVYSQSASVASLAEPKLAADGIPTDALRFVMLGANPSGVPDNLYPTEVYDIYGDSYALPATAGTTTQSLTFGAEEHDAYLGLTPAEIALATPTHEGMTTVFVIPELTSGELYAALIAAAPAGT